MNINRLHGQVRRFAYLFLLMCLLTVNIGSVRAASGCSVIYNGNNGWVMDICATDASITTPMKILVDGLSKGNAALVRIYHKSENSAGTPQVAVIYASGYVRLKQNANPSPSIPFGTSFILGPAYSPTVSTYYNNPQLNQLEVDTTWLPNSPLRMRAQGANHNFAIIYDMTMPPPRDRQTRLHVTQTYTATANVNIDPTRRSERQGFKLVQASSMFIPSGSTCIGGYTDCHDSNAARFMGSDLVRHQVVFANLTLPAFVFGSPIPLGSTWFDILHTDDQSWQSATGAGTSGNTPNVRITLDDLPTTHTITAQGWIDVSTNPNEDKVGLWLHDDGPASVSWLIGQSDQVSYWLLAQDNPPEPFADLSLRPGSTFLNFEGTYNCFPVKDAAQSTAATVSSISGFTDTALQLNYNLGNSNNNWAQVRCNFNPPLNLSAYDHLRFEWRGNPAAGNSLQVGLISPSAGGENIFARGYHHATQRAWWGQMVVPFNFLDGWTPGTHFDPSHVSALFISVIKDGSDDVGGSGSFAIDNLGAYNVSSRTVPGVFETVDTNHSAAQAAANWLASQQKSTGLLKSWQEEGSCVAHTYDQALALIVFADQGMWTEADALVDGLAAIQNADGSWFKSRNCATLASIDGSKWEGDIAWAIYAMSRYLNLGGTHTQAATALKKGADWLATRVSPADGCLVIDHTEGTIDAWWAFQAAGVNHASNAAKIKNCLLTYYWDNAMGHFKGGRNWWQPYLDNQTWGAAFLKAIGETTKAHRALSYARDVLRLPAQGGELFGFDGQAGPWSVWNEGTAQYIAVGGDGANDLVRELLAQQQNDGAMTGSPDEFNGGGVWTSRWHGVAPTAWLYNALSDEPFHPSSQVSITGNAGVAGVTLAYTDNGPKSVLADGSGNYTISVPSGWTGTVTPKKIGYQFIPVNKSYSNVQSNQASQNYTAAVCASCADKDTVGVFRPGNGALYLRNLNVTGFADVAINYGLGGDYPVVGDWDGNGTDTIGIYRNGTFYLRNFNSLGFANITVAFGSPGDQPIAGDWNNDGIDTIGVYRSSTGTFLLRNSNTPGPADVTFALGNVGDVGIAGDWNGDGTDTTGVFRPSNGVIFLKNKNESGFADIALNYGLPGDQPVVGDWDNNGTTTIGIYRNARFYLRNSNTNGFANIQLDLGNVGDIPIGGNWDAKP